MDERNNRNDWLKGIFDSINSEFETAKKENPMDDAAKALYDLFASMIKVGFTEDQAIKIVMGMLAQAVNQNK